MGQKTVNPIEKLLDTTYSFTIRVLLRFSFFATLLAYLLWEVYWYTKVGLTCVKFHTHLMLGAYLYGFGYVAFSLFEVKQEKAWNILFSICFGFFILELLLGISGRFDSYTEKSKQGYQSPYTSLASYYNTGHGEITISREEYTFTYPLNTLGFPDKEWDTAPKKRILALGDSFTHGDGEAYGGAYIFRLDKLIKAQNEDSLYEVMNAGFCGSDPFFNYVNLRDRLVPYSPNIVIQMIASHDLFNDFAVRGGMERFLPNGKLKYRKGPWWEPLWAMSYIVRAVVGENALYTTVTQEEAEKELNSLFEMYTELCQNKNITLLVVIRPELHELKKGTYDFDFSAFSQRLKVQKNVYIVDLFPYYQAYVKQRNDSFENYFWKKDAHHNAMGYQMMAEGVYEALKPLLKDSISSN